MTTDDFKMCVIEIYKTLETVEADLISGRVMEARDALKRTLGALQEIAYPMGEENRPADRLRDALRDTMQHLERARFTSRRK